MTTNALFCHLTSTGIAELITTANRSVCYAGPGIQREPALALVEAAIHLTPEMITVCVDFDERVMRMGYGDIEALRCLHEAQIEVRNAPGLRSALIIIDDEGFIFTPTALYLEAESSNEMDLNAMRLNRAQAAEARARLSPEAKMIAKALATTPEERERIGALSVDVSSEKIQEIQLVEVENNLKSAPPVKFDLARQVRVFEPYLQYVELSLSGAAIQRHRLAIPPNIQKLGGSKDLEGRLRTTFDLIEKSSQLSSKRLENDLNEIRTNFTPSLGKDHGRVVLKAAKPHLLKRLEGFCEKLELHRESVKENLQQHLDASRQQVVDYYCSRVADTPPDALLGQLLNGGRPSKDDACAWLHAELDRVFPSAESLIQEMKIEIRFKDVTFETLNRKDFLESVKKSFPRVDWDKTYNEFKAAGESPVKNKELPAP